MKHKVFFDRRHAESYLLSSIITYKSEPFMVAEIGGRTPYVAILSPINRALRSVEVPLDHPDLDLNPVPLGFINVVIADGERQEVMKAMRLPRRAWKIGLCSDNLRISALDSSSDSFLTGVSPSTILGNMGFRNTVVGQFPKFHEAVQTSQKVHSVAFGRKFALRKGNIHHLLHREPIGKYTSSGVYQTVEPYDFLHESLERAVQT